MAFTVTATPGGASFQNGVNLLVRVLVNATEAGGASGGSANTAAGIPQGSLTPNFSSSFVAFAISQDGVGSMGAAATNNTYDNNYNNGTQGWSTAHGHYTGTVTAGTPLTYGAGANGTGGTGADHENWCAYEVPASGGTITVDGSSPAAVNQDSVTSITTASFNPPGGAVLVAMVTAGGTGTGAGMTCTITDSSGTGMVWTRRAISSTSDNFQPTFVFTATLPLNLTPFTRSAVAQTSRTWQRRWTRTVRPDIPPQVQQIGVHAGLATATGAAGNPPGFKPFLTSVGGSGYNSWLADQHGSPKLMLSEQAWALPWNAGRWNSGNWQSDYTAYFSTRASQGYNAWFGVVWGNSHVDSTALSGGRTWDGIYPLNVNGTPGAIATGTETITLNGSFWSRVDAFITTAMNNGITVFMNLSMSYDISDAGGIWQHATNTQGTAFGNALASRYSQVNYPNLQWFWGDDDDGPNDSFYQAILTGIQNAGDTRALISVEQFTNTNCHIEFDNGTAFSGTFGKPNATYNWCYCYDATYFGVEDSYAEGGTFAHIPPVYGDGVYYGDTGSGTNTDRVMRTFAWWALAFGARGVTATSGPSDLGGGGLWTWQSGAAGRLTSDPNGNGTWCTSVIGAITSYVSGLTDWNKLIPDTGNVFITAGRGTRGTCDAPGGVFNFRNASNYVAGSVTPNGTLAVIYCKAAMSITIDQTKMNAGYTATWVDPVTLAQTSTATGSTYSSSGLGNNSAGDPDWVLVLQGPPGIPAGLATGAATALSPVVTVTALAGLATGAGAALQPSVSTSGNTTVNAGLATGTGVALGPSVTDSGTSAQGAGTGSAPGAVVTVLASAGLASGAGAAQAGQRVIPAGLATGAAAAQPPAITVLAQAAAAHALAAALGATGQAIAPFTVGRRTAATQSGVNATSTYAPTGAASTQSGVNTSTTSP